MKYKITIKKENLIIKDIECSHFPFLIGRSKKADLTLDDPHISRQHAELIFEEDKLFLLKRKEKIEISAPMSFDIPPYTFIIDMVQEEISLIEETEALMADLKIPSTVNEETKVASEHPQAKIVILKGSSPHESYDLIGHDVVIGRDENCDISIEDPKASREHARIFLKNNHYMISDLESSNGVCVNHKPIQTDHPLTSGDHIQIGDSILQFALFSEHLQSLNQTSSFSESTADATKTGVMIPQWNTPQSPIKSYGLLSQNFFHRYKKPIYAGLAMIFLCIVYLSIQPSSSSKVQRSTAQENHQSLVTPQEQDPLGSLVKEDREYILVKMNEAKDLIKNRKYAQANIVLQEIFVIVPNYKGAKALEETIRYTLDQQAEEEEKHQGRVEEQKLDEEIKYHLRIALDYFNREQWEKAAAEYEKILELNPEHEEAQRKKMTIAEKLQKKIHSSTKKTASTKNKNKKAEQLLAEGSTLSEAGQINQAMEKWRKVLKIEGINPEYYSKADQFIQYAKNKLNEKYTPLLAQVNALIESKEYLQAEQIVNAILSDSPSHAEALEALQTIRNALHQRARQEYTEAIIEENLGRTDQANAKFKWIIEKIPASDEYHRKAKAKLKKYE